MAARKKRPTRKKAPTRKRSTRKRKSDPTTHYAEQVVAGQIIAGPLVVLACERHLRDLEQYGTEPSEEHLYFDVPRAQALFDFFLVLRHAKGEWGGGPCLKCSSTGLWSGRICANCDGEGYIPPRPFELAAWQKFIIGCCFGWKRPGGTRRFRTAYVEIPKKNGKTTLAGGAAIAFCILDGEEGAEVYIAATKKEQAQICFKLTKKMIERTPEVLDEFDVFRGSLSHGATGSHIEALASDTNTMDGPSPHAAIIDELHAHKDSSVVEVMDNSTMARRQPFLFEITTAGEGGDEWHVCWRHHVYTEQILKGDAVDDSWFGYIANAGDNPDWKSPTTWAKANPNYGVSVDPVKFAERARRVAEMPADLNDFKRYNLNIWTESKSVWITSDVWKKQTARTPVDELRGRDCYGGLDLASTQDVTALEVGFFDDDGNGLDVLSYFWLPEDDIVMREKRDRVPWRLWAEQGFVTLTPGNVTDYDYIFKRVEELRGIYNLRCIGFDPHNALQVALKIQESGGEVLRFSQGFGAMAGPTKEIERFLGLRSFRHGENPVLGWMARNASIKENSYGERKVEKPQTKGGTQRSPFKVDGIVASCMTVGTWMTYEGDDDEPSVYEERDLRSF